MSRPLPRRIVVSRTDRIGDVVLTLPLCAMLRRAVRDAHIIFLARAYTRPVVTCSPYVDEVVVWDSLATGGVDTGTALLASMNADAIFHVAPNRAIARAAKRARIERRIGTSHRLFHWTTCNELVAVSRKRSELHEAQLNLQLARDWLGATEWPVATLVPLTELRPRVPVPAWVDKLLTADRFNLLLHPRSGGSSAEWPLDHFHALATTLDPQRVRIFVTGSATEAPELRAWISSLGTAAVDLTGRLQLEELIAALHAADGFIGGSTGPLHLAAGVGIHALGLYPARRPMHPGRWAPLGPRAEVLTATVSCADCGRSGACTCMTTITPEAVAQRVGAWVAGA
jgi:ADP-heptose:LPS heptosyltransferase